MAVSVKKDFEAGDEVARMQGIGGNDADAAANIMTPQMNGWASSQYELFNIKLGRQQVKDISDKPSVVWGSWLEGPVLEKINKTKHKHKELLDVRFVPLLETNVLETPIH